MAFVKTAMPATARHGEPASENERFAGGLDAESSIELQVRQLKRRCAISFALATAIAPLAFGERA